MTPQQPVTNSHQFPPATPSMTAGIAASFNPAGSYISDPARIGALTFPQAMKYCFVNFVTGTGRAARSEYWYFYLGYILIMFLAGFIFSSPDQKWITDLLQLAIAVPTIASGVRRMHDVGKSGWFLLIPIYNLILLCTEGEQHPNTYGEPVDYRPFLSGNV